MPKTTDAPAAEAPAAPERKPAEAWATGKGYLPAMLSGGALPAGGIPMEPVDRGFAAVALARSGLTGPRPNPNYRLFLAAKVMHHWPEGLVMTEAEFDKAVTAADTGVVIR